MPARHTGYAAASGVKSSAIISGCESASASSLTGISSKPVKAFFQRAQCLLHRFFEAAAHGHHFADRFHRCVQRALRPEFFKREARDFCNDVINRRFERLQASCRL
jgi:hypothetical protein